MREYIVLPNLRLKMLTGVMPWSLYGILISCTVAVAAAAAKTTRIIRWTSDYLRKAIMLE